ncbi:DUF58 domain-containing protein [Candidatus Marinamargulisbacteria bacterium SCGC AG-343-D04]|nr:DUF58 domain-containing protein [Candidatus Marinamargulisbacteria bacterium SCGC AG-343-D04]
MIPKELIQKVKSLEIKTRKIVDSTFSGNYQSAFKGKGLNFADLRSYQVGDDVRSINWKVSARSSDTHVNLFEEERELNVIILVDVSGSGYFGSREKTKMDMAAEIAAVLGFSAVNNSDKVGLLLFSDVVERFIPPKKGKEHMLRILRDIYYTSPSSKQTNISVSMTHIMNMVKKRSVIFLISDFLDHHYLKSMKIVAKKHDLVPIVIEDSREIELPKSGILALEDQESGQVMYVNSGSASVRKAYHNMKYASRLEQDRHFRSMNCDSIRLNTVDDYVLPLIRFFNKRLQRL